MWEKAEKRAMEPGWMVERDGEDVKDVPQVTNTSLGSHH